MIDRRAVLGIGAALLAMQSQDVEACSFVDPSPDELKLPVEFANAIGLGDLERARSLLAPDFFFNNGSGSFGGYGADEFISQLRSLQGTSGRLLTLEVKPIAQMFFRTVLQESARHAKELPKGGMRTSCDSIVRVEERMALYQTNNAMKINRLSYLPLWSY